MHQSSTAGDRVTVANLNQVAHNRLPAYIRGKVGTVTFDHGVFVFPDTSAHRQGPKPQHVYTVVFTARELWGEAGHPQDRMYVDAWDDYLESRTSALPTFIPSASLRIFQ